MLEQKTYRKTATIKAVQFDGTNASHIPGVCTGECRGNLIGERQKLTKARR